MCSAHVVAAARTRLARTIPGSHTLTPRTTGAFQHVVDMEPIRTSGKVTGFMASSREVRIEQKESSSLTGQTLPAGRGRLGGMASCGGAAGCAALEALCPEASGAAFEGGGALFEGEVLMATGETGEGWLQGATAPPQGSGSGLQVRAHPHRIVVSKLRARETHLAPISPCVASSRAGRDRDLGRRDREPLVLVGTGHPQVRPCVASRAAYPSRVGMRAGREGRACEGWV